jgi:hypothetical protein
MRDSRLVSNKDFDEIRTVCHVQENYGNGLDSIYIVDVLILSVHNYHLKLMLTY